MGEYIIYKKHLSSDIIIVIPGDWFMLAHDITQLRPADIELEVLAAGRSRVPYEESRFTTFRRRSSISAESLLESDFTFKK